MRRFLLAAMLVLYGASPALAQSNYPNRSIRFIVPFAAGGSTDSQARILGEAMSKRLGEPVVVENIGGAGGTIGTTTVAHAAPDGYTILAATPALTINPHIQKNIPYNPLRDFTPVIQTTTSPMVLVVRPASPIHTVAGLIRLAKAKPGELKYGSAGIGSIDHLSSAMFAAMAHIKMTHIPYRGAGPALIDLLAGRTDLQFENAPTVLSQIRAGKLRAVAVGTAQASPLLPGVPTVASTVPGYEASSWFGLLVPAKTPKPIVDKLHAVMVAVLKDPAIQKHFASLGLTMVGGSSESFGAFLKKKVADMSIAAKAADLKPQ